MFKVTTIDNLVLVRLFTLDTVKEAREVVKEVSGFVQTQERVVAAVDFRPAKLFSPEVTDLLVALLRSDNPRIQRSAHVLSGSALSALQIERMVRESQNPNRKTFREVKDAEDFLARHLNPAQRQRLHEWYDEVK